MNYKWKFAFMTISVILVLIGTQVVFNILNGYEDVLSNYNDNEELYKDEKWKNPVFHFKTSDQESVEGQFYMELSIYDQFNVDGILVNKISSLYNTNMRYRGSSSSYYPKKQYRLTILKDHKDDDKAVSLLGLNEGSKWILNGPYLDKSYTRTYLMYYLSRELFEWAPEVKLCEVFIDDAYQGIYFLIEPIEVSKNRVDLNEFGLLNGQIPFLIKRDRVDEDDLILETYGSENNYTTNDLLLIYPNKRKISDRHKTWIEDYLSRFEKVLYSSEYNHKLTGYHNYIDVDNFINYYVLNLFSHNDDAGNLSTYIYRDLDSKLKMVPWDFNNSLGLYPNSTPENIDDELYNWYSKLLKDPWFREAVSTRYHELRKTILSKEYLDNLILEFQSPNTEAFLRDIAKWHYELDLRNSTIPLELNLFRQVNSTNNMKIFMYEMIDYLDENIEELLVREFSK